MIEPVILEYLQTRTDIPVKFERSPDMAPPAIIIEKTGGGGRPESLHSTTLAVQSYGKSLAAAMNLNEMVKEYMFDAEQLPEICEVHLNSDYNYSDTATKRYRYQAVFVITHY